MTPTRPASPAASTAGAHRGRAAEAFGEEFAARTFGAAEVV